MSDGTHVEARKWIKRLPEGRGQALDAGAKAVLQELWDHVTWTIEHDVTESSCWPSRERIAEGIGTNAETVKKRLDRLAAAGWIRRTGDGFALAWGRPFPDSGHAVPEHHQAPGEPNPRHPGNPIPDTRGTQSPTPGEPNPRNQGIEPSIDQGTDHGSAAVPDPDPIDAVLAEAGDHRRRCERCTRDTEHVTLGRDRAQCSACGSVVAALATATSSPTTAELKPMPCRPCRRSTPHEPINSARARCSECGHVRTTTMGKVKRKPAAAGQAALDLGAPPPEPDHAAELLALHQRLRAAAQAHHGDAVTELPKAGSKAGKSLRRGLAAAVKARGRDWCERMLAWRGQTWLGDEAQLPWSAESVWTKPSLQYAADRMGQPARASPSRAPRLSAPPPGEPTEYVPSFTESETDPCEMF